MSDTAYTMTDWAKEVYDSCKDITTNTLRDLAAAYREGRVVVLPCKVGDVVFMLSPIDCEDCKHGSDMDNCEFPCPWEIEEVKFQMWMSDAGQRKAAQVYITRAEAERALATRSAEGNE